jgi:hypothetical protein
MSSENFDSIRVLLRLKRYEQPPPRYFNEFSCIVIARIEAGERGHASFWERFGFDLRPVLAGALGATACGLVLFGPRGFRSAGMGQFQFLLRQHHGADCRDTN